MPKHHAHLQSHIHKELWTTPFVSIRKDHHRRPLDCPRADKWFLVDIAGRHDRVSVDPLKVARVELASIAGHIVPGKSAADITRVHDYFSTNEFIHIIELSQLKVVSCVGLSINRLFKILMLFMILMDSIVRIRLFVLKACVAAIMFMGIAIAREAMVQVCPPDCM
ncbi:hypothetical protein CAPTEDRAFT_199537 [Capitella teleta]|uniref:Uncharacterized protein n=1 Tax=Capitella teleta TaxID=283909 RepID=R7UNP8_CAPTE|nr:hypothetical protein CAPTEDRAFT_199537 [Capitella teleta]|eukprot:ELU07728.1 hypothetical protein CAPTEDRAFT_199537 [Capitella teleta]